MGWFTFRSGNELGTSVFKSHFSDVYSGSFFNTRPHVSVSSMKSGM